jgi:hypothetical protein
MSPHEVGARAQDFGHRGTYAIEIAGSRETLKGIGYEQLSMVVLPRQFITPDEARDYAERLDRVSNMELQASGA